MNLPLAGSVSSGRRRAYGIIAIALCTMLVSYGCGVGLRVFAASSQQVRVSVAEDGYTYELKPTSVRGSDSKMRVDASPVMRSYVKFNVSGVSDPVTNVSLVLNAVTKSRGIRVSTTSNSWNESTLSWRSAPDPGMELGSAGITPNGSTATVDVTDAVTGDGTYSFVITSDSSTQQVWGTKEGGNGAVLVVTTSDPSQTDTSPSTQATTTTTTTTTPTSPTPTPTPTSSSALPIRAAFYYPWFPEAWNQSGYSPFTWYNPSLGFYDGGSEATIMHHIVDMQYAGMDAGIASWWGQGSRTDGRIATLLKVAEPTTFRWSLYYEPEGSSNPSVSQIDSDLTYLAANYASHPNFLRVDGRPVLFVYGDPSDDCSTADRWAAANQSRFYVVLKVFSGYRNCASQPDGWHQYAPAKTSDSQMGYSYSVSPGFWLRSESTPRLPRDPATFTKAVQDMAASNAPFQLVTTFNEWGEGTATESAQEWATSSGEGTYLDILHLVLGDPQASTTNDPVIAAAGDIACDPADGGFNGGSGTSNHCRMKATSDLLGSIPDLAGVLTLGDNQYEQGELANFQTSYGPSWGRYFDKTYPAVGNHENLTAGAAGYFQYFGSRAGDPSKGYYSYDLGAWHLVALNSSCSAAGGCGSGSPQETWLRSDLAAHPAQCTLAYWHEPRFSSGQHGSNTRYDAFWRALQAGGADVVLNGHDHDYERFDPQTADATASPTGIRAFVVGTGGKNHYGFSTVAPNSAVRNSDTYGVLQFTLHSGSYDWKFVPEPGKTFSDSGSAACH